MHCCNNRFCCLVKNISRVVVWSLFIEIMRAQPKNATGKDFSVLWLHLLNVVDILLLLAPFTCGLQVHYNSGVFCLHLKTTWLFSSWGGLLLFLCVLFFRWDKTRGFSAAGDKFWPQCHWGLGVPSSPDLSFPQCCHQARPPRPAFPPRPNQRHPQPGPSLQRHQRTRSCQPLWHPSHHLHQLPPACRDAAQVAAFIFLQAPRGKLLTVVRPCSEQRALHSDRKGLGWFSLWWVCFSLLGGETTVSR